MLKLLYKLNLRIDILFLFNKTPIKLQSRTEQL